MKPTPQFEKHILVCTNERAEDSPRGSCARCGGNEIRVKLAELLKQNGLKGRMRASKTGCLDACELGAVVVIYPQDLWYVGVKPEDAEEIFNTSILGDGIVERLVATEASWEKLKALRA
jgi:(2Fe-2S) ferredoxin